jgi:membrane-associated phospholipid phosphatase
MLPASKQLRYFYIPTFIFMLIGGFFIAFYSKADIHIFMNGFHKPFADRFFAFITYLGEGWLFLAAIPMALLVNMRSGIHIALTGLFTLLLTALFKQVLFAGAPRPLEYFKDSYDLYLVPGVEIHSWNSFPSGHTMAAFGLYLALATWTENKWLVLLCFFLAISVGLSRVYLSQHFLVDVEVGAVLGIVSASLGYYVSTLFKSRKLDVPLIKR